MKNALLVKIQHPLEPVALRILRTVPNLTVTAESGDRGRRDDAVLHFAGRRAPIAVEFKRDVNAATAWQVVHGVKARRPIPLLLIADETTAEARTILRDNGIALVDALGNAHVELPGLLFHLEGRRRPQPLAAVGRARLSGRAGVIAQALLLQPEHPWHVEDLANVAQASPALAHRIVTRLEREGIMRAEGTGPNRVRRVTNPTGLLDLWAEEHIDRPMRTPGHFLAQTPQQVAERVGRNLGNAGIDYALTGAGAARLVAPFVTAVSVVDLWVGASAERDKLFEDTHVVPVTEGQNVNFLQAKDDTPLAFRERVKGIWVANRFRLYADLLRDPRRGKEQASRLREEVIGF